MKTQDHKYLELKARTEAAVRERCGTLPALLAAARPRPPAPCPRDTLGMPSTPSTPC